MEAVLFATFSYDWRHKPTQYPKEFDAWSQFHGIDFFEYRTMLADASKSSRIQTNLRSHITTIDWLNPKVGEAVVYFLSLTPDQIDYLSYFDYIVHVDDDELYSPQLKPLLEQTHNKCPDADVIIWDNLVFEIHNGDLRTYNMYGKPYFENDIGHFIHGNASHLASGTYAISSKWLLRNVKERQRCLLSHGWAATLFNTKDTKIARVAAPPQVCKIMHGANVSALEMTTPLRPLLNPTWKPHWPEAFREQFQMIQEGTNRLFDLSLLNSYFR